MKIIVTHGSPDWDAIASVWLIKKYLAGWQDAQVRFVPAGNRISHFAEASRDKQNSEGIDPVEKIGEDEVIHVDTGLGPLDHHQTQDLLVSAASLTWDFIQKHLKEAGEKFTDEHKEAVSRIVRFVVDTDHFQEVYWENPVADYHEFSFLGLLDGFKLEKPDQDEAAVNFGIECLNAITVQFENRIWAEKEIKEHGIAFETRYGKGIGFETINDTVLKLSQKMGYVIVIRKDPRKGYLRIKTLPVRSNNQKQSDKKKNIDLTLLSEQLKKMDPDATWFLHVSKKMLLNGSPKNPKMKPTKLTLDKIISVVKKI